MTPIINPWAIYLISRLDTIKTALAVSIGLLFCITTIFVFSEGESWENLKKAGVRKIYTLAGILLIMNCFIPDAKTGVMILTTHYLTQETFDKGIDFVEKTTDHIIDKVKELNDN